MILGTKTDDEEKDEDVEKAYKLNNSMKKSTKDKYTSHNCCGYEIET